MTNYLEMDKQLVLEVLGNNQLSTKEIADKLFLNRRRVVYIVKILEADRKVECITNLADLRQRKYKVKESV